MKREIIVIVLVATLGGVFLSVSYVNPYNDELLLSELIMQLSGSRGELILGFSMTDLLSLAIRMVPDFILEMYFGTLLYQHFCTASIYVFSRYPKRLKWYIREILVLGVQITICQALLLLSVLLVSIIRVQVQFDMQGVFLLFCHLMLKSIWVFAMALSVNLLAVLLESDLAFLCVMGIQTFLITILGLIDDLDKEVSIYLLKWNPMAHLVLGWHNTELIIRKKVSNWHFTGLDMEGSIIQLGIICLLVIIAGAVIINRHDLLCSLVEEGEI